MGRSGQEPHKKKSYPPSPLCRHMPSRPAQAEPASRDMAGRLLPNHLPQHPQVVPAPHLAHVGRGEAARSIGGELEEVGGGADDGVAGPSSAPRSLPMATCSMPTRSAT